MSGRVVVAGGGTAGHVYPALAVAGALVERGHARADVQFVGSTRGQERTLLAGQGFPVLLLPGRGIRRSVSPGALADNAGAVLGLCWATLRALALLTRRRPRAVVSVGGYASFPAGAAAVLLRVPLVLVNVDSVPGLVHRLLGRFAVASAVGFPGTALPRPVVTGTPVREALRAVDRCPAAVKGAREALGIPSHRRVVVVTSGSLGAQRINDAVTALAGHWVDRDDVAIYHVVGRRQWAEQQRSQQPYLASVEVAGPGLWYRRVEFEQRMALAYAAADVLIGRAGAMTVAELAVAGVPSVLVPLPGAPGDHQTANASALVAAGAAQMLADPECNAERLAALLDGIFDDPGRLASMAEAARRLGRPDAAARIAQLVDEVTAGE